ncbi:GlsB/YeaQ/YmgE family stress response membrane protein [Patulibacter sp. NPDC049589]|uniref:GlsB/YeaQ/YmgE family stress response membrane protein n=1 Tax=Patulibacter sp. NPDC049589 TaxID=3154731 RepID=UPI00341248E0
MNVNGRRERSDEDGEPIAIGLVGALVGYFIFTRGLGIGDDDAFDLGGLLSAVIGVVVVLVAYQAIAGRRSRA